MKQDPRVIEEVVAVAVSGMLGERVAAVVATVSGGHREISYPTPKCIHAEPRIDGLALRTVGHGITDSQGIGRCGERELDKIPLTFKQDRPPAGCFRGECCKSTVGSDDAAIGGTVLRLILHKFER